jgi:hypothetical protein
VLKSLARRLLRWTVTPRERIATSRDSGRRRRQESGR